MVFITVSQRPVKYADDTKRIKYLGSFQLVT